MNFVGIRINATIDVVNDELELCLVCFHAFEYRVEHNTLISFLIGDPARGEE